MANILVIEDEINVSSFIKRGLEEEGHTVEVAYDGAMGFSLASSIDFDIIILDIILPQMNGIELCREIRSKIGFDVSVIMLSALGSTDDIVKGLETGADDYLVKPFKFKELLARINVMLRHKDSGNYTKKYEIADLSLDMETKTVTRSGKVILLTSKELRLLEYFLANKGKVLSRTSILENVWDYNVDMSTNVVEVYINYLRKKVDKGFDVKLIHTLIGIGYVLKEG
ncbi:MAG: response regulator transcription factor [Paludibacteraceae bacterium]|nr:response regulator transcription factor [Paludibacteraceae bacterium]